MDSGFGAEDGYGVYSKPMFNRGEAQSVYKPKTDDGDAWGDADQQMSQLTGTERFRADRGFKVIYLIYLRVRLRFDLSFAQRPDRDEVGVLFPG